MWEQILPGLRIKLFMTLVLGVVYPLAITGTMTVLQLLSIAGGLGDYAKGEKIRIVRNDGIKQVSFRFNYKEVLNEQKLAQNIELKPGDTVVVP